MPTIVCALAYRGCAHVTEAAGRLQHAGVISYRRGHIKVLDRTKLEGLSCECYQVDELILR